MATTGEEALKIYKQQSGTIYLLLMDLGMPGIGVKMCLMAIRRLDPEARVIIASGYIEYELTGELKSLMAAGMIFKPYKKS